jgi:hypothetical protein
VEYLPNSPPCSFVLLFVLLFLFKPRYQSVVLPSHPHIAHLVPPNVLGRESGHAPTSSSSILVSSAFLHPSRSRYNQVTFPISSFVLLLAYPKRLASLEVYKDAFASSFWTTAETIADRCMGHGPDLRYGCTSRRKRR